MNTPSPLKPQDARSDERVVPLRPAITAANLRRIDKGSVVGSVEITIAPWHMKITCLWLRTEKGEFLSLPSEKFTDRSGKTIYRRLVEFTDDAAHNRFQIAALEAARRLL